MAEFEPNEWQKRALANIHVIDKPGEWGTGVFVGQGDLPKRIPNRFLKLPCYPIGCFADINNTDLPDRIDRDARINIRQRLIEKRPEGYAFKPTPEEQLKIDRVFLELCKFPEVSMHMRDEAPNIIAIGKDNYLNFCTEEKNPQASYYDFSKMVLINDISFENEHKLTSNTLEEMLHAQAAYERIIYLLPNGSSLTPVDKMQSLMDEAGNIKSLQRQQLGFDEQVIRIQNMFGRQQQNPTLLALRQVALSLRQDSGTDILGTVDRFIQDILGVYTNPAYASAKPEIRSEELYVKCMKGYMICNKESHVFGEFFLNRLNMPAVAKGLREDRAHLLALYHRTPEDERMKGDWYAESVARRLEEQGIRTLFNFGRGRG